MTHPVKWPIRWPSPAACRFFTAEDAVRWALAAYYGASRDIQPPKGEPWHSEFGPWTTPAAFGDAVVTRFLGSVVAAAIDARIPCDHGCATPSFGWDDRGFPGSRADAFEPGFSGDQGNDVPQLSVGRESEAAQGVQGG